MNPLQWLQKERLIRKADRFARRGNSEKALELLNETRDRFPGNLDVEIQRVWMIADLKRFDEALVLLNPLLTAKPKNGFLHLLHGEVLYALGRYEEAKTALLLSLELSGENLRSEYALGLVYIALKDMERASRYFESIVRYDKHLVQSRLLAMAEAFLFERQNRAV